MEPNDTVAVPLSTVYRILSLLGELDGVSDEMTFAQIVLANQGFEIEQQLEPLLARTYRVIGQERYGTHDAQVGDLVVGVPSTILPEERIKLLRTTDGEQIHGTVSRALLKEAE